MYTFNQAGQDPIATAIASLWYSWANYYAIAMRHVDARAEPFTGSIAAGSNILVLTNATPGLVPGMAVTDAQGTSHGVITAVASDNKTITLSQAQSGALADNFNFASAGRRVDRGLRPHGPDADQDVHVRHRPAELRPGIRAECVRGDEPP